MAQEYKHILVPVDGSKEVELASKKTVAVAKRSGTGTELRLLHVVDTHALQNISSFDTSMVGQVTETAKKTLDKYIDYTEEHGVGNASYSIEYGVPKTIIARGMPKEIGADLIMIGATGLNAVERISVGSVTEFVTRAAICDVLVVRADLGGRPIENPKKHRF